MSTEPIGNRVAGCNPALGADLFAVCSERAAAVAVTESATAGSAGLAPAERRNDPVRAGHLAV